MAKHRTGILIITSCLLKPFHIHSVLTAGKGTICSLHSFPRGVPAPIQSALHRISTAHRRVLCKPSDRPSSVRSHTHSGPSSRSAAGARACVRACVRVLIRGLHLSLGAPARPAGLVPIHHLRHSFSKYPTSLVRVRLDSPPRRCMHTDCLPRIFVSLRRGR